MNLAELEKETFLRPTELNKFGARVKIFKTEPKLCEDWPDAHKRTRLEVWDYIQRHGGQVYTGIHSESDWTEECQWDKGWYISNRTGNYAVILPE